MRIKPWEIDLHLGDPHFISSTKHILQGRNKIKSLYDSYNWEFEKWDRSTQRSWKKQRRNQYKVRRVS